MSARQDAGRAGSAQNLRRKIAADDSYFVTLLSSATNNGTARSSSVAGSTSPSGIVARNLLIVFGSYVGF
jgi:hypothetical protein